MRWRRVYRAAAARDVSQHSRVSEMGQGWRLPGRTTGLSEPWAKQQPTAPFIRVKDVHDL